MKIGTTTTFEAAHRLPKHPGMCARLHGHSYKVEVEVDGPREATGTVVWFETVDELVGGWIRERLDHRFIASPEEDPALLAAVPGHVICKTGEPTAENLAAWIGLEARRLISETTTAPLAFCVRVYEIHGWGACWAEFTL